MKQGSLKENLCQIQPNDGNPAMRIEAWFYLPYLLSKKKVLASISETFLTSVFFRYIFGVNCYETENSKETFLLKLVLQILVSFHVICNEINQIVITECKQGEVWELKIPEILEFY